MKSQDYDENEKNNNDKDDENGASDTDESLDRAELIEKTGEVVSHNAKHLIHCLTVIGQVEGHYVLPSQNKTTKYEHIMPALVAIEQDRTIEGLVIILNTGGTGNCGAYSGHENADRIPCCRGRSFNRRSPCSQRDEVVYRSVRDYDHTSGKNERTCFGSASDAFIF